MLRRLVRRFSEERVVDAVAAGSGDRDAFSEKMTAELSVDSEDDEEDETDRWIMEAGGANGFDPSLEGNARQSGQRLVWIPDASIMWKVASVTAESADGSWYTVIPSDGGGEIKVSAAKCADYDPSHSLDLADASRMNQMHEGPLLDLLNRRFHANTIYTNVADVLVSINPYKHIPGLYDIPMPAATPPKPSLALTDEATSTSSASSLAGRGVQGPSSGSRVAERAAALMRGFHENSGRGAPKSSSHPHWGRRSESVRPDDEKGPVPSNGHSQSKVKEDVARGTKARLAALKSILGKPHVYGVADRAFQYMAETQGREVNGRIRKRNQSILITGESGSGKTEASKHVMRFLTTASRALAGSESVELSSGGVRDTARGTVDDTATATSAVEHMEDILLKSNTVLEAFGNAKTVRNDNSSRFGKYIKLMYDEDCCLIGAKTEHFLLEKSRLVHLDDGERSYHILYQVPKSLSRKMKVELRLVAGAKAFKLLNQGNCLDASEGVDDREEFKAVDKALSSLEFSKGEKEDIWRLIAAILHSGEVRFEDLPGTDHCRMVQTGDVDRKRKLTLSAGELAALWGVEKVKLEAGVMQRTVTVGDSSASVKLNAAQAKDNLLALLKHMYRQLFAWINWKINAVFNVPGGIQGRGSGFGHTFIGILDIFGFEIMATNSFEQLCINYANEVLQRQFNHHIFVLEQEEYGAEGLDVASIPFRDNQSIINLIAKRPAGLMPILEDQALTGRQAASLRASFTDKNLIELFHQQHHRRAPHPCYRKPRFDGPEFVVMHYAGDVTYCATGFLEKNNDTLQEDLRALLLSSSIPFLRQLILDEENGTFELGALDSRNGFPCDRPPPKDIRTKQLEANGGSCSGASAVETSAKAQSYPLARSGGKLKMAVKTKMAARTTVSNAFRRQLDDLVTQLGSTEPHYIKCIKPNSSKEPGGWSNSLVIEQLRYSGVLEVVRIRREAFPMRVAYKQFYRRFGKLVSHKNGRWPLAEDMTTNEEVHSAGLEICVKVFGKNRAGTSFQLGKTKIFLRNDGLKRLRAALRQHYFDLAVRIQVIWRGAAARVWFSRQRDAAVKIQQIARGKIAKQRYQEVRLATVLVQAIVRMQISRRSYERCQTSAVSIQTLWRWWRQRGSQTRNASATRLQAIVKGFVIRRRKAKAEAASKLQMSLAPIVRGFLLRRRIERRKKSIIALQAAFRGVTTRKIIATEAEKKIAAEAAEREAAATRVAAMWRGKLQRLRDYEMGVSATKIQTLVRGRAARAACKAKAAKVLKVQGAARMLLAKKGFKRTRASELRAQRAIRAFLRNRHLRNRSVKIFEAARCGDVPSVSLLLSEWPELLFVRDCHNTAGNEAGLPSYATLLHAACQGGSTDVATLLEPFLADVMAVDRWGNTSVHAAAARCDYDTLKLLARRANFDTAAAIRSDATDHAALEPTAFPTGISKEAFSFATTMVRRMRLSDAAITQSRDSKRRENISTDFGNAEMSGELVGSLPPLEGLLKKRRKTGRWKKRWCCIRQFSPPPAGEGEHGPALVYYRAKSDQIPSKVIMLRHCVLKRLPHVSHAFGLQSPTMMSSRNKEGRLYFQAGGEKDVQRWLVPLRVLVKFCDFENDGRTLPKEFLDLAIRRRLVRAQNHRGQTPLHLAAAFTGSEASVIGASEVVEAIQRVSTWLIEYGADPNTYDGQGETSMHYAAAAAQPAVLKEFENRGGDRHLERGSDGKTAADLLLPPQKMELERRTCDIITKQKIIRSTNAPNKQLLKPPVKLFGFTYVSLFLENLRLGSSVNLTQPALTVSVFCPKGKLVEPAQDVTSPVLTLPNYLWWAHTWHMQTPLETLGTGSMMVFELRDIQAVDKTILFWGVLPLDHSFLNTQPERMPSFLPPTNPARLIKSRESSGCLGLAGGGSGGDSAAPPIPGAYLTGDVFLTRVLRY